MNETLTLISTYTLFVFTQFVPEPEARYEVGWALVGVVSIMLSANILVIFYESAVNSVTRLRLKYQRWQYEKSMRKRQIKFETASLRREHVGIRESS